MVTTQDREMTLENPVPQEHGVIGRQLTLAQIYGMAKAQRMRNKISKLDESCDNIEANVAKVKRSAQQFVESMIAVIAVKKQAIF